MTNRKLFIALLLITALFFSLPGCAKKTAQAPQDELLPVKTIVVLPVEIAPADKDGRDEKEKSQLEAGRKTLDAILAESLSGQEQIAILTEAQRDSLDKGFTRCRTTAAVNICRTYKADAVLLCTVHRFVEREGTEYSVINPASVVFEYKLVHAETGQTLCGGVFNETQKPLLENIFQFFKKAKRGVKWLTAADLARDGVQQKIINCAYLKK